MADDSSLATATFAGGCFWCMEAEFYNVSGVRKVVSGYTGGDVANPTYQQVSAGDTHHVEAIEITYEPTRVSYEKLLDIFWSNVDPLDPYGQFCDKGTQYRAGIFVHDEQQEKLARQSYEKMEARLGTKLATFIRKAEIFYPAEDYHQEYFIKNKTRYKIYRDGCGRDSRLKQLQEGEK